MKKFLSLLLALTMVLALVACGGKPSNDTGKKDDAPASSGEPVELTLASWRPDDTAQLTAIIADYKKVAPNVTITYQPINPPDYNATLRLQLDGGVGPDLDVRPLLRHR